MLNFNGRLLKRAKCLIGVPFPPAIKGKDDIPDFFIHSGRPPLQAWPRRVRVKTEITSRRPKTRLAAIPGVKPEWSRKAVRAAMIVIRVKISIQPSMEGGTP